MNEHEKMRLTLCAKNLASHYGRDLASVPVTAFAHEASQHLYAQCEEMLEMPRQYAVRAVTDPIYHQHTQ